MSTLFVCNKSESRGLWLILTAWILYTAFYVALKHSESLKIYSGIFSLFFESGLNLVVAGYAFWLWKNSADAFRRVFGFFTISFLQVTLAMVLYHLIFNVLFLKVSYFEVNGLSILAQHISYITCMIFEFLAWLSIILLIKNKPRRFWLYVSLLFLVAIMLAIFSFSGQWKLAQFATSKMMLTKTIIVLFHITIFILAAVALVLSKSKSVGYLALGYLLILGADLILDFGVFSQALGVGSIFETVWFLGELFVVWAFINFKRTGEYKKALAL